MPSLYLHGGGDQENILGLEDVTLWLMFHVTHFFTCSIGLYSKKRTYTTEETAGYDNVRGQVDKRAKGFTPSDPARYGEK